MFRFVIAVILTSVCVISADEGKNDTIINGCVFSRKSDKQPTQWGVYFPQLNCSNRELTVFDPTGFPDDVASIILSFNKLTSVKIDDFANFTKLKNLDLKHNSIAEIVPSARNPPTELTACNHLSITYNELTEIPTEALRSIPGLTSFGISGNKIKKIGDNDFETIPKVAFLGMGSNPYEEISPKAWTNLTNTLHILTLSFSGIKEVPDFLSNMPKLIYLSLANNNISNIQGYSFAGTKQLRWLELASNKIVRLDPHAFSGMGALTYLDLTDNMLETLPPYAFNTMNDEGQLSVELYENPIRCDCRMGWLKLWTDSLHFQDIRYKCMQPKRHHGKKAYEMKIEDFTCRSDEVDWSDTCNGTVKPKTESTTVKPQSNPSGSQNNICPSNCKCFDSEGKQYYPTPVAPNQLLGTRRWWRRMIAYPHVDCTDAGLKVLPDNIRTDVVTLSLADNNIREINLRDLKKFKNLKTLDLEDCGLKTIRSDSSAVFDKLLSLSVHHNNLKSLDKNVLKSFPKLTLLRMYNNKITEMPEDMFKYNRNLHRLHIGPNPVKAFDAKCLAGLDIYSLSLRNMSLKEIPKIKSKNMTYFEISDNKITKIKNNTFADLPLLFRMTIDNNQISTIEKSAFNGSSKLKYLDMSENRLTTLPKGVFDDLDEDRIHIELWRNQLNCDCNLRWFKQWIEKLEDDNPLTEIRFTCFTPVELHGRRSDTLGPGDFTCNGPQKTYNSEQDVEDAAYVAVHGRCYSQGEMALAVVLTIVFMAFTALLIKCCIRRKKGAYARFKAHHESNSQLDMDMQ